MLLSLVTMPLFIEYKTKIEMDIGIVRFDLQCAAIGRGRFLQCRLCMIGDAKIDQAGYVLRSDPETRFEGLDATIDVALRHQDGRQVLPRRRQFGVDDQGMFKSLACIVQLALGPENMTKMVIGDRIIVAYQHRPAKRPRGVVKTAQVVHGAAEISVGARKVRVRVQRLEKSLHGFLHFPLAHEQFAEIVLSDDKIRLQSDRALVHGGGFLESIVDLQKIAQAVYETGLERLQCNRLLYQTLCVFESPLPAIDVAEAMQGIRMLRLDLQNLQIQSLGRLEITLELGLLCLPVYVGSRLCLFVHLTLGGRPVWTFHGIIRDYRGREQIGGTFG